VKLNGNGCLLITENESTELLNYLYSVPKYRKLYELDNDSFNDDDYVDIIYKYLNYNGLKKEWSQHKGRINYVRIVGEGQDEWEVRKCVNDVCYLFDDNELGF
jgi:hypothetical protein